MEEDAGNPELRDRRDRRYAAGARLGGARAPAAVRARGRAADHGHGHGEFRGDARLHAGGDDGADDAVEGDGGGAEIEERRWGEPDPVRVQRRMLDLRVEPAGVRPDESPGRRRRTPRTG